MTVIFLALFFVAVGQLTSNCLSAIVVVEVAAVVETAVVFVGAAVVVVALDSCLVDNVGFVFRIELLADVGFVIDSGLVVERGDAVVLVGAVISDSWIADGHLPL